MIILYMHIKFDLDTIFGIDLDETMRIFNSSVWMEITKNENKER